MFEKEMDELYELCKRVVHEVPDAYITFYYSPICLSISGKKDKNAVYELNKDNFYWDISETIYNNPELEENSRAAYKSAKAYLLELLIDGKCPHE